MTDDNLPPLPDFTKWRSQGYIWAYTADQMRQYALDAVALNTCLDTAELLALLVEARDRLRWLSRLSTDRIDAALAKHAQGASDESR